MLVAPAWKEDLQEYHEKLRAEPQFFCTECKFELPESFMKEPGKCFLCTPLTEEEQEMLDADLRV